MKNREDGGKRSRTQKGSQPLGLRRFHGPSEASMACQRTEGQAFMAGWFEKRRGEKRGNTED
jgi:hypothetical protein